MDLSLSTLYQDEYLNIPGGYAPVTKIEKISSNNGDYYKLSIDSGYNRDIRDQGSLYGRLSIHQKTKVIGSVSAGSSTIDVDSTIGFPNKGDLYVRYEDSSSGVVSYTSKSTNQFFNCSK